MNKRTLFLLINGPVWAIALSIVFVVGRLSRLPENVGLSDILFGLHFAVLSLVYIFSSFYIFYSYLIPKYWRNNKKKTFWIIAFLVIFIIEPIFYLLGYPVLLHIISPEMFVYDIRSLLLSWIPLSGIALLIGALGVLCRNIYDSVANKESRKEVENTKLQSELNALKAKLNPHLLFNSINNIDSLILTNPELASTLLSKLSDLLRYVIYDTEEDQISIHKEISNLNKYIDLEKIRLVNPGSVSFSTKITKEVFIPPMLFFPFVENGFKHSNLNKEGQKLSIAISVENNILSFESVNTVLENPKTEEKSGVGLMIVQKRLDLLYSGKYELTMKQENNEFHVTLQIKLD